MSDAVAETLSPRVKLRIRRTAHDSPKSKPRTPLLPALHASAPVQPAGTAAIAAAAVADNASDSQYKEYVHSILNNCKLLTNLMAQQQTSITSLTTQCKTQQSIVNTLTAKLNDNTTNQQKLIQCTAELTELKAAHSVLQTQHTDLQYAHKQLQATTSNSDVKHTLLQNQYDALRTQHTALQFSYQALQSEHAQCSAVPAVATSNNTSSEPLDTADVQAKHVAAVQQLNNTIVQLQQQNSVLDSINARHNTVIAALHDKCTELELSNHKLQCSNDKYSTDYNHTLLQYTQCKQQYDAVNDKYSKLSRKYDKCEQLYNEQKSTAIDLQYQLDELQAANAALQSQLDSIDTVHQTKIDELTRTIVELRLQSDDRLTELQRMTDTVRDKDQHLSTYTTLTADVQALTDQHAAHLQQCAAEKTQAEQLLQSTQEQCSKLTNSMLALKTQHRALEAQYDMLVQRSAADTKAANEHKLKSVTASNDALQYGKQLAELHSVIHKLIANEQSTEASLTCTVCMQLYRAAVTCTPCGHSFCRECIESATVGRQCTLCNNQQVVQYHTNDLLNEIVGKFVYRQQALASIKVMTEKQSGEVVAMHAIQTAG